jgi:hypothetical protein
VNSQSFLLLAKLADEAGAAPGWEQFAACCQHRLRGMRREAFEALQSFLDESSSWDGQQCRKFTAWFCDTLEEASSLSRGTVPFPLLGRLIQPALIEWTSTTTDAAPERWLGLLWPGVVVRRRAVLSSTGRTAR